MSAAAGVMTALILEDLGFGHAPLRVPGGTLLGPAP